MPRGAAPPGPAAPGRSQRRTHFELGVLLQLQRLLLHLRQAQRLLGVSCRGARALGHGGGQCSRACPGAAKDHSS